MANAILSINRTMLQEDSKLAGVVTLDAGGRTRFGIAEKYHPWMASIGFYTTMPTAQAIGAATVLYQREYCMPLQVAAIQDQTLADKLVSLGLNEGVSHPIMWLQEAIGQKADGIFGLGTLRALSAADPQKVLDSLKQQAVTYYQDVVKENPSDEKYLSGWLRRANA